jgi:hypothetical protein
MTDRKGEEIRMERTLPLSVFAIHSEEGLETNSSFCTDESNNIEEVLFILALDLTEKEGR